MNLSNLDRSQLEAILLNPPGGSASDPLVCSDNAVAEYISKAPVTPEPRIQHALAAAHELLTRIAAESIKGRSVVADPSAMKSFLRVFFAGAQRESFVVVFIDTDNRVIAAEEMFLGTLTEVHVYPRQIIRRALALNAAAVCLSHVHPSGQTEPSRADEHLTAAVARALATVDIRLLDHIVVAADGSSLTSMAERGLL